MSRRRGDWDEDFDAGGPRRREEGPPFGPPRGYEYDERERPRAGRRFGAGGDYDDAIQGRGEYYRDEYYTGRRPEGRDFEESYERGRHAGRRGAARSHLRCRDIMTRDVTVAARDTTLEEVARMMRDEDTGVIPVVEPGETASDSVTEVHRVPARTVANGKLVGLITDRDIVIRAIAEGADARQLRKHPRGL